MVICNHIFVICWILENKEKNQRKNLKYVVLNFLCNLIWNYFLFLWLKVLHIYYQKLYLFEKIFYYYFDLRDLNWYYLYSYYFFLSSFNFDSELLLKILLLEFLSPLLFIWLILFFWIIMYHLIDYYYEFGFWNLKIFVENFFA